MIPNDNGTDLEIEMGGSESEAAEEMSQAFYPGMEIIKRLSENPILIAVQVFVRSPIENVWKHWTLPEHIMQWNNASPDWHTTSAKNDLKDGGKFNYRMEAKAEANGGVIKRGRAINGESARQKRLAEREAKLAAGVVVKRARPAQPKTEVVVAEEVK